MRTLKRSCVLAVALSAMLPFLVAQTFFAQIARNADLEDGRRLLVATSRGVAGSLDGFFEANLRTTRTLAVAVAGLPDRAPARLSPLLDSTRALGGDDVAGVFVLDARGRYVAGSPTSATLPPGTSLADRDYYIGATRTRKPYVSSGFASRTATGNYAALAVPLIGLYEISIIAATFVGGASAYGGVGTVAGTLIGALFFGVLNIGMGIMSIPIDYQFAIKALVLIAAVYFDVSSKKDS